MDTARNYHMPRTNGAPGTVSSGTHGCFHLTVTVQNLILRIATPRGIGNPRDDVSSHCWALTGCWTARPPLRRRKQRVALTARCCPAPRMLMDEPSRALDSARKHEILPAHLEQLRRAPGPPILYVTKGRGDHPPADTLVLLRGWPHRGRVRCAMRCPGSCLCPASGVRGGLDRVIEATVVSHADDGLSERGSAPGLSICPASPPSSVRLRIMAQDVMLASKPAPLA
jgi:hypothetical protein